MNLKRRSILINTALLIISTLFALVLGEIALRLMGRSPLYVSPERDRFWKYDPLLGWAHEPGQAGIFETEQFRTYVNINSKGLRDQDHAYERTNDASRILVIGDSFAWGYGVEERERFSQLLESWLGAEVINAGVSGYSTDQELLWLKGEGIKYETDLIVLVFTGNDIGDNDQQLVNTIYYKPQFVREKGNLILKGYPAPKTGWQGRLIYYLSQRSALFYFLVRGYFDMLPYYRGLKNNPGIADAQASLAGSVDEPFGLTIALLEETRKTADSMGARFMIVATDRWWNSRSGEAYKDFIEKLHAEGFLVMDVESMPGFDPSAMVVPMDGHWNRAGHEFVAKTMLNFIESHQLLTPLQVESR